jgi:hypothetical protein
MRTDQSGRRPLLSRRGLPAAPSGRLADPARCSHRMIAQKCHLWLSSGQPQSQSAGHVARLVSRANGGCWLNQPPEMRLLVCRRLTQQYRCPPPTRTLNATQGKAAEHRRSDGAGSPASVLHSALGWVCVMTPGLWTINQVGDVAHTAPSTPSMFRLANQASVTSCHITMTQGSVPLTRQAADLPPVRRASMQSHDRAPILNLKAARLDGKDSPTSASRSPLRPTTWWTGVGAIYSIQDGLFHAHIGPVYAELI